MPTGMRKLSRVGRGPHGLNLPASGSGISARRGAPLSARFLLTFFDSVYVITLTAWIGSILFFSFAIAPLIFRVLDAESAAKFVRALFPRYYLWGAISGAVALPAFVAGPLCFHEYRGIRIAIQAMAILGCILIMLYGANSLVPEINRARDAGPAGEDRFARLHRRSVWLNGLVLIVGVGLLIAFAARPVPRTAGILELTPGSGLAMMPRSAESSRTSKPGTACGPSDPLHPANLPVRTRSSGRMSSRRSSPTTTDRLHRSPSRARRPSFGRPGPRAQRGVSDRHTLADHEAIDVDSMDRGRAYHALSARGRALPSPCQGSRRR